MPFDYCFISDAGEIVSEDDFNAAGDGAIKVLVIRDSRSKALFAHVVPSKGIDQKGFAVSSLVDDVKWLGYTKVTLKSDNEPAIVKLLSETLRELRIQGMEQALEEHSPEYDPKSNGSAEVGVKLLKGHFRTLRSSVEDRLGYRIPVKHPVMAWLIRHAANLVTWCARGHDGQTAYQRVRLREFKTRLLAFGELCSFKNRMLEPLGSNVDGRRFHQGVFVGVDRRTGQYMIYSDEGLKMARTVMRMPDANKWNREALAAVRATPWDLHASKEPEVVFKPSGEDAEKPFEQQETLSRNLYLRADDFEKHGLTRGCPKCDQFLRRGDWKLTSGPHSSSCRTRITTELAKDVAGQIRIAKASGRMMKDVDRIVQASTDQPQGEKVDVVQDRPIADNVPPPFVALPGRETARDAIANGRLPPPAAPGAAVDSESREVPPSPDEPGVGETRGTSGEGLDMSQAHEYDGGHGGSTIGDGGMEIDAVDLGHATSEDVDLGHATNASELRELMAVMQREEKQAIEAANRDILAVIKSIGGSVGKYRRERQRALRAVVSEVYSPPRVTAAAKLLPELRVIPGFALDLTTADTDGASWDFDNKVMRDRALKKVREEKPLLLIGSPMCTAFSTWQRINDKIRDKYIVECEKKRAIMHLEFSIQLYREQLKHGRYFLHEHPAYATSWQEEAMQQLEKEMGVVTSVCDQCLYGCEAEDGSPIKKPTKFITNSVEISKQLCDRCLGRNGECSRATGGNHRQCRGKTARMAAVYHFKLCRAILIGFRNQLKADGKYKDGFIGILEDSNEHEEVEVYRLKDSSGAVFHVHV